MILYNRLLPCQRKRTYLTKYILGFLSTYYDQNLVYKNRTEGGSTITQQLVKNLTQNTAPKITVIDSPMGGENYSENFSLLLNISDKVSGFVDNLGTGKNLSNLFDQRIADGLDDLISGALGFRISNIPEISNEVLDDDFKFILSGIPTTAPFSAITG